MRESVGEMVGLDELFQGAREELGLPEPQMRRYEVTRQRSDNLREEVVTVEAEGFEWDKDEVCFLANAVTVYVLDRRRLISIRDLGAATVAEETGDQG